METAVTEKKEKKEKKESYLISEAAKQVEVEAHVLRYWEEELKLPIQRNKLGQRFYTKEDIANFCLIKKWKEEGMQLRGIRNALKKREQTEIEVVTEQVKDLESAAEKEKKAARLQFLLSQMMKEAVQENNELLMAGVKEMIAKELGEQFRQQEERDLEREKKRIEREEEHFKKIDEMLRVRREKTAEKKKKWAPLGASH